jgi:meso-butanediol dehydrogenase/(S,S)-butanediol dehydrogenase/diacetyl reductase
LFVIKGINSDNKRSVDMEHLGRLKGKTAIITGAASGIGLATSLLFAREGADLLLADMNEEGLNKLAGLLKEEGITVITRKVDVSNEEEVKGLIEGFTNLDILVNNAGVMGDISSLEEQDAAAWIKTYEVNVMGAVYTTKYAAPSMMANKSGAIVNVASVAGMRSGAGNNAYSASKAGLISFTQTSACDLGGFGVRVNAVCPGLVETGMTQAVFDYARNAGKEDRLGYRCELKRYGRPEEIAKAILFLASDDASYITGQALPVDGGNTASLNLPGMKY